MFTLALKAVFWTGVGLISYTYVGYPMLLWLVSRIRRRPWRRDEKYLPTVSVLVCAYNEEDCIRERIENILQQDYPSDRIELLVGSDASTDCTDEIVADYADRGVRLIRQEPRGGKSQLLNRLAQEAKGEVLVFTDANTIFEPDAIRKLVRNLADPAVGCVSGYQGYLDSAQGVGAHEGTYWSYEMWLWEREALVSSVVGADGAIFAMRKELFSELRPWETNDDALPIGVVLEGYRVVYDGEARAWERTSGSFRGEFQRRRRMANRAWRTVWRQRRALNPVATGPFAWQLFSHRILRWLSAFVLVPTALATFPLAATGTFYAVLASLEAVGLLAFAGAVTVGRRGSFARALGLPYYGCLLNFAAALGATEAILGKGFSVWEPKRKASETFACSSAAGTIPASETSQYRPGGGEASAADPSLGPRQ